MNEEIKNETVEETKQNQVEGNNKQQDKVDTSNEIKKEEKTFTQDELDSILQKRLDREFKKYNEKLKQEKSEAERLAKMSEDEKQKELLKAEMEKLNEEKQKFYAEKMEAETIKQLSEMNLPTQFSSFLVGQTAEETKESLEKFNNLMQDYTKGKIEEIVNERLKGTTPKKGVISNTSMTLADFNRLPTNKKMQLLQENPDLLGNLKK